MGSTTDSTAGESGAFWARVETVVLGASERSFDDEASIDDDSDGLEAYLDAACAGDEALRATVDRLLDPSAEPCRTLVAAIDAGVAEVAASWLETPRTSGPAPTPAPMDRIGPWRLIERLGEGGTGTVYRARRVDAESESSDDDVAIKILRHGPWSAVSARRFEAERRILGRLDHPHIARLLDGGATVDGSPYLVMELVEGEPIDRYCAQRKLTVDECLELFLAVCAAVHDAHRNLVVHRDLKPSNVLVTEDGVPKLLDFGIAKLLEPDAETLTGSLVPMTPRWASPEQLASEPVTTASDVYSLGLLLYEMLTGRHAFGEAGSPAAVIETRRQAGEPERPSAVASPARRRRLRGDLDTILGMALAVEPARRYASVAQFAEDIERHLEQRPVRARADTPVYRIGRFVRRHRLGVAVVSAFLCLVLAALLVVTEQARRIARERDRVTQVSEMLADLFEVADPATGDAITARELLDRGADRVRELPAEPDTAMLFATLARLYGELGLFDRVVPLYERSLAIRRDAFGSEHPDVAEDTNALAIALARAGNLDRAEGYFREALEIRRRLYGDEHPKVAASVNNLALVRHDLGRYRAARELYEHALALDRRLLGERDPGTVTTRSNLALLYFDEGKYVAAAEQYEAVLASLRSEGREDDPATIEPRQMLALSLAELGENQRARDLARRALESRRRQVGDDHRDTARALDALGLVLLRTGDAASAVEPLESALSRRLELLGETHAETAASLERVAELRRAAGEIDAAIAFQRRALGAYRAALPADHPLRASATVTLSSLQVEAGRCADAAPALATVVPILVEALGEDAWPVAEALALAALCGDDPGGFERARDRVASRLGERHRRVRSLEKLADLGDLAVR